VPPLRAVTYDARRSPIQSWRIAVEPARLQPGQSAAFDSALRDAGDAVAEISVTFEP
jgi:hypothetical protein